MRYLYFRYNATFAIKCYYIATKSYFYYVDSTKCYIAATKIKLCNSLIISDAQNATNATSLFLVPKNIFFPIFEELERIGIKKGGLLTKVSWKRCFELNSDFVKGVRSLLERNILLFYCYISLFFFLLVRLAYV